MPLAKDPYCSGNFRSFLRDVACLGVSAVDYSESGLPYGIFRARSNDRYWMLPLSPRSATLSGLAMFQPISPFARLAKRAARSAIGLRLDGLWAHSRIRLSSLPQLESGFGDHVAACSYFSGTDGPHRKSAIQFMNREGIILGYGKISRNSKISPFIEAEAAALDRVRQLDLKSAGFPRKRVLARIQGATCLVTDSRKSRSMRVPVDPGAEHIAFLRELAGRTRTPGKASGGTALAENLKKASFLATEPWRKRFGRGADMLRSWGSDIETCFAHGDFTPWNSFMDSQGLYVFDWEYARDDAPVGYDLTCFILSRAIDGHVQRVNARLIEDLTTVHFPANATRAARHYLASLLVHSAFYQARQASFTPPNDAWSDAERYGRLIDALLGQAD